MTAEALSHVTILALTLFGLLSIGAGVFTLLVEGRTAPEGSWAARMERHMGVREEGQKHRAAIRRSSVPVIGFGVIMLVVACVI